MNEKSYIQGRLRNTFQHVQDIIIKIHTLPRWKTVPKQTLLNSHNAFDKPIYAVINNSRENIRFFVQLYILSTDMPVYYAFN